MIAVIPVQARDMFFVMRCDALPLWMEIGVAVGAFRETPLRVGWHYRASPALRVPFAERKGRFCLAAGLPLPPPEGGKPFKRGAKTGFQTHRQSLGNRDE